MLKRLISRSFWILSEHSLLLQNRFQGLGLRGKPEWVKGRRSCLRLPNERTLLLAYPEQNYMTFALHWIGLSYHEPITTLLFFELLKKSKVFFDIGANVGYFSLIAAMYHPKLQVTSFEPNPKLNRILTENVAINNLSIKVESMAVSNCAKEQPLFIAHSDMSASLEPDFRETASEVIVESISLDQYAGKRLPDNGVLIKIDVEGHESQVIQGSADIISRYHPDFVVEVIDSDETNNILTDNDYSFYEIGRTGLSEARPNTEIRGDKKYANFFATTMDPRAVSKLNDRLRKCISCLTEKRLDEVSCY